MMPTKTFAPFALILALTLAASLGLPAVPALAQPGPTPAMVRKYDDWGLYSYKSGSATTCYILTTPQQAEPESVDHGDNFFLVAPDPSGAGYYTQAIMGYDLRSGSPMTVTIDGRAFAMLPKGNSGWTAQASSDAAMIDAMKTGSAMTLQAVSGRGTETRYTFSLSGVTAALGEAGRCR
jgi:invasion protein IalB